MDKPQNQMYAVVSPGNGNPNSNWEIATFLLPGSVQEVDFRVPILVSFVKFRACSFKDAIQRLLPYLANYHVIIESNLPMAEPVMSGLLKAGFTGNMTAMHSSRVSRQYIFEMMRGMGGVEAHHVMQYISKRTQLVTDLDVMEELRLLLMGYLYPENVAIQKTVDSLNKLSLY
jgi:hypothetical protein